MLPSRALAFQSSNAPSTPSPDLTAYPDTASSLPSTERMTPALPSTPSRNPTGALATGASLAVCGQENSGRKRTIGRVGPQWRPSAMPPRPLPIDNYPKYSPGGYNPFIEYIPSGARSGAERATASSMYEAPRGVDSSPAKDVQDIVDNSQLAVATAAVSTDGDDKNKG